MPSSSKKHVLRVTKRNAQKRGYVFALTDSYALSIMRLPCHYCGCSPSNRCVQGRSVFRYNGIDRVRNGTGYTKANCVPCCRNCNVSKGTRSAAVFLKWARRLVAHSATP